MFSIGTGEVAVRAWNAEHLLRKSLPGFMAGLYAACVRLFEKSQIAGIIISLLLIVLSILFGCSCPCRWKTPPLRRVVEGIVFLIIEVIMFVLGFGELVMPLGIFVYGLDGRGFGGITHQ
jgi:hypothetical protein